MRTLLLLVFVLAVGGCSALDKAIVAAQPKLTPAEMSVLGDVGSCAVSEVYYFDTLSGELGEGDCQAPPFGGSRGGYANSVDFSGHYVDYYGIKWDRNKHLNGELIVWLSSDDFDAYVAVLDKNGVVIDRNDDGGEGINARIMKNLVEGVYLIVVTSSRPGSGAYTLNLSWNRPTS